MSMMRMRASVALTLAARASAKLMSPAAASTLTLAMPGYRPLADAAGELAVVVEFQQRPFDRGVLNVRVVECRLELDAVVCAHLCADDRDGAFRSVHGGDGFERGGEASQRGLPRCWWLQVSADRPAVIVDVGGVVGDRVPPQPVDVDRLRDGIRSWGRLERAGLQLGDPLLERPETLPELPVLHRSGRGSGRSDSPQLVHLVARGSRIGCLQFPHRALSHCGQTAAQPGPGTYISVRRPLLLHNLQ